MKNNFQEKMKEMQQTASAEVTAQVATQAINQESFLSFVSPVDVVDLPSKGKFYPPGHPLHNKAFIEIKQMTAKEEDILTNKSLIRKGLVIDRLVQSLLVDQKIKANEILVGDKNAIIIAARISGYGAEYGLTLTCGSCAEPNEVTVSLLDTKIKDFEKIREEVKEIDIINHEKLSQGRIVMKLPRTGWEVECLLLTGIEEKAMLDLQEKRRVENEDADITISDQLNYIIKSVNGVDDIKLVNAAINIMPAYDAKLLRNTYQKMIPNIAIKNKLVCSSCAGEQEVEVPFTQEFFWPE